jgi:hypothetical protein
MFGQGSQGGPLTFANFWLQLTTAFKCLAIATLALALLGLSTQLFTLALANILYQTFNKLHIWRLTTSFLVDQSIINVLFNLYLLNNLLPDLVIE